MADTSSARATVHKRSRAGCHTCKSRKVKCERAAETSGDDDTLSTSQCVNCQRLGFQCRWRAPVVGEEYAPPPKRRRTIAQRRDATAATSNDGDAQQDRNLRTEPEPSKPSYGQFDMFGDLSFDLDFGLASGALDLSLTGEGLDFVPLPAVDASMLQDLSNFATSSAYLASSSAQTPSVATTMATTTDRGGVMDAADSSHTSVDSNNRHLIQHYLDVMKGYAKVEDRPRDANNMFISAFTRSLYFPPLFHAILAFSASHLAMEDPSYADQADDFSRLAGESFDTFRRAENFEADGLLSALFVRVKTVHMLAGSVDSFLDLIAAAADIVSTQRPEVAVASEYASSPLTGRIMLRLAILDARASYHRIGGGRLVNLLRDMPVFSPLFARDFPPTGSEGALFNLLRADILRMRVAELDVRLHEQLESEFVTQAPIRTDEVKTLYGDIQYEIEQWNSEMAKTVDMSDAEPLIEDRVLGSTAYGYYVVLSALHSAQLYLCTVYPMPPFNIEQTISKVLQYQLKITLDPSRATSPSSILPSSMFMAGLMTSDPVHRHWILQLLKSGEKWGTYIKKARELLEAMLMQPAGSDVRDTMDKVTGRFII